VLPIECIETGRDTIQLSVIVAAEPMRELIETLAAARARLDALSMPYETICITDGRDARTMGALAALQREWRELVVLGQQPWIDDDAALSVALRRARGDLVLTLAGWPEVALDDLARLPAALGDADIVSAVRAGLPSSGWLAWRRRRFTRLLVLLFGQSPSDPFCRTRLARREVLEDVAGFGVRQQFIPVIAGQRGYKLAEIELRVPPGPAGTARYVFRPLGHLRAFFDALTLYVVLNFLRRPLRFFGSVGLPIFVVGALVSIVLVVQRLAGHSLADRPALIFSVLMVVLGVQIIAIGLVGEIIVFSNSRRMKQYTVREVIQHGRSTTPDPEAPDLVAPEQGRS
jgi:hypothetical protein